MKTRYLITATLLAAVFSVSAGEATNEQQFMSLDTDNDGFLTQTELSSVKITAERWTAIDINKDGRLEKAEFALLNRAETFVPVEEDNEPMGAAPTD
jgi:hypothetical protein